MSRPPRHDPKPGEVWTRQAYDSPRCRRRVLAVLRSVSHPVDLVDREDADGHMDRGVVKLGDWHRRGWRLVA